MVYGVYMSRNDVSSKVVKQRRKSIVFYEQNSNRICKNKNKNKNNVPDDYPSMYRIMNLTAC